MDDVTSSSEFLSPPAPGFKNPSTNTHLSNKRFPSRPRALAILLGSGLGLGFCAATGSAAGVLVAAGSSVDFLVSAGVDSEAGAEINALIWKYQETMRSAQKSRSDPTDLNPYDPPAAISKQTRLKIKAECRSNKSFSFLLHCCKTSFALSLFSASIEEV